MPSRSVIAIRGLPQGSNFTEGRPYGDSEWNLKPDQIGDLDLILPADASGDFKLGIALIAPDDHIVAEAETQLEVTPAPAPAQQAAVEASSIPSPDGIEGAVPVPAPDTGDGVELEQRPLTTEESIAPSGDAAPDKIEQPMEAATAPPADVPPDAVEQAEDTGLDLVQPSVFVNLREEPSSSSTVIGVIAKGAKLSVLDRKRGWVQVTDPETAKKGWIYSGLLAGEAKPHYRRKRAAPAEAEPKSDSFWGRVGRWLSPS